MKIINEEAFFVYNKNNIRKIVDKITSIIEDKTNSILYIFAIINFIPLAQSIKKQLKDKNIDIKVIKTKHSFYNMQILGCDIEYIADKIKRKRKHQFCLFIGDGYFHPVALLKYFFLDKFIIYNPVDNQLTLAEDDQNLKNYITKIEKIEKIALNKFLLAKIVGLIFSTKPGQQYRIDLEILKEKYKEKKFYYFLADSLQPSELENFPFIDIWINTACPRIMYDDFDQFKHKIINISLVL